MSYLPRTPLLILLFFIFLAHLPAGLCGDDNDFSSAEDKLNSGANTLFAQAVYERLMNLTGSFQGEMGSDFDYCITDAKKEWGDAFNFSSDLTFLTNCVQETKGDISQRLCTAAEVKFHFSSYFDSGGTKNYLKPNRNCNLTSWTDGCEPGWACSLAQNDKVNLKSTTIPTRTVGCRPCCEGFFCPQGITCMIPCPLGAYCPRGKLNTVTGLCDPYKYQLPPGDTNHTCGGADKWGDVITSESVFCPAGYYCPSTTRKISCSSGHYCRKGSTSQIRCFKKSSCAPNSKNQDITIFGALLMAALSFLLVIIYNFSGQILTSRERKQAKSREAAARHVRETAQARERWKSAKDVAKKHAVGLQSSLSRTFSRKKSSKTDILKGFGFSRGSDDSKSGESKRKDLGNLTQMMQNIEDNPDGQEGFNLEIGEKNKKNMPKGKQMHTRSQIFKYAYGQIEKEKAMQENNNLTFSGIISLATDNEIRSRPVIEVAFKDLSLTLAGSKKKLLRSVTGTLMPGRVAAVMGPSGAGKTTFLSAVAGKATGCVTTGLVLINGKVEPLRSYKRIIGFVPQDDIVHGNLTVEENLWFSARCRLSEDLSKADKVLVVERVIESLGLQAIRESLVGTVEKRGISGGQRK